MTDSPPDVPRKGRRPRTPPELQPFAMLYLGEVHDLTRTLTLQQHRVFLGLIRQMAYNESFRYSTGRLAAELGMHLAKVSLAIRHLKDLGVVLPVGPERNRIYLNPRFAWRGTRPGRVIAQLELLRLYPAASFLPAVTDEDLAVLDQPDLPDEEPTPEEDR